MSRSLRALLPVVASLALAACPPTAPREGPLDPVGGEDTTIPGSGTGATTTGEPPVADESAPGEKKLQPPTAAEKAPKPSPRTDPPADLAHAPRNLKSWFDGQRSHRLYVQVDKPVYQPGETIWIKTWDLVAKELKGEPGESAHVYQLKSPKGAVVEEKRVQASKGYATNDFVLPEGAQGGEYTLVVNGPGGVVEKTVLVQSYEPPRIKKKLEFVRKAYGPGEEVTATIIVNRPTGEPLADHPLRARIRLDGQDLDEVRLTTNKDGGGLVRARLPANIELGDGLLTVLVEDGGVTESVSKRVPIVLKKVRMDFFPEGGRPVVGLESRVYFEAKNPLGKPADVEGVVVDDLGNVAAKLASHWGGLGRFTYTPQPGRTYAVEVQKPAGVTTKLPLPLPADSGCVLRHFDDLDGELEDLRVSVQCTEERRVGVVAMSRDQLVDAAFVTVTLDEPAVVFLRAEDRALARGQGVATVTVLDEHKNPLAERVVYRNRRSRLFVEVKPQRESYMPRDQVSLTVTTKDLDGKPVPAEVALSVVDDTVVSFADDKSGHILSRLFLEQDIPGAPLEEPRFFLDLTEAKSALALDLLMGTRGYRRFEWREALEPPVDILSMADRVAEGAGAPPPEPAMAFDDQPMAKAERALAEPEDAAPRPKRMAAKAAPRPMAPRPMAAKPMAAAPPPPPPVVRARVAEAKDAAPGRGKAQHREAAGKKMRARPERDPDVGGRRADKPVAALENRIVVDEDFRGAGERDRRVGGIVAEPPRPVGWAPVRVFPAPAYGGTEVVGPRSDFRETIFWAPTVRTDRSGQATVTFYLSDAVTSFRVFTEGVGAGLVGRSEDVIRSSLPFSLAIKLPLEVSAGDQLKLPLILTNERSAPTSVDFKATFGDLLRAKDASVLSAKSLAANARESLILEVDVTGTRGQSELAIAASASGLQDEIRRTLKVEPLGFPQEASASGQVSDKAKHTFDLKGAEKGTVTARVSFFPSTVSTVVSGLEGLLRQPSGCFEQASSSNYPNVMILQQLQASGDVAPAILERTQGYLDEGYRRLTGYEARSKGYEWFGADPGHEALTAYGLLEFVDMKGVYDVDQAMIDRTATWLLSRQDGQGGFQRNAKALDTFGRASAEVTNGYIAWALSEAGYAARIGPVIEAQRKVASSTQDAYLLAMASNTLQNHSPTKSEGEKAAARLEKLQEKDGSFTKADHSVTRSGGNNLVIETTALSALALMKAGKLGPAREAIGWLMANRGGYGQWGATQATILSLKAVIRFAEASRQTPAPGTVIVKINGKVAGRLNYEAGRKEPMVFDDLAGALTQGKNELVLLHDGKGALPYTVAVEWRTTTPASSPDAVVALQTSLEKTQLKMGDTVRAWATVKNKTAQGQPMTLVRVGLPGGLTFQAWQLKELKEQNKIAFYETRPREVILYFRQLEPNEEKKIPLDLVATVPGRYTGPASRAYLYYTDEHKVWTDPFQVEVEPG